MLARLLEVKQQNKDRLCRLLWSEQGLDLDPSSVFDVQIKRFHEYKRQQMNALAVIHQYLEIKAGRLPQRPVTVLFGGKAAPAYVMAKHIIHLILCLQKLIEQDPQVRPWLRVAMIENYNVTWAEALIPACDISEQISLASKEASGTGNMKFMANGAVTLGTMDGANVEIAGLVGKGNIYTFGASSDQVIALYRDKAYDPGLLSPAPGGAAGGLFGLAGAAGHWRPGQSVYPVARYEEQGLVHGSAGCGGLYPAGPGPSATMGTAWPGGRRCW